MDVMVQTVLQDAQLAGYMILLGFADSILVVTAVGVAEVAFKALIKLAGGR